MGRQPKKIDPKKELLKQQDKAATKTITDFFYHLSLQIALGNIEPFPITTEQDQYGSGFAKEVKSI